MDRFVPFVDVGMDGEWRSGRDNAGSMNAGERVWSDDDGDGYEGWRLWEEMMRWY